MSGGSVCRKHKLIGRRVRRDGYCTHGAHGSVQEGVEKPSDGFALACRTEVTLHRPQTYYSIQLQLCKGPVLYICNCESGRD